MTMPAGSLETLQAQVALAETVRQAVLGVPGVLRISPGNGYIEATYGRDVEVVGVGVSTQDGRVSVNVHLVVVETPMLPLAKRVRKIVRKTIRQHADLPVGPINVYLDDLEIASLPPESMA
jgi:uncharacterized alkaline shock family protein YloU